MALVVISLASDGRLALKSRYDPGLVDAIKTMIPSWDRTWDADVKTWYLAPEWGDGLIDTLRERGMTVTDMRPSPPPPQTTAVAVASALQEACVALHITPDAPVAVAEASFKALAKQHHPDVGGDTAIFQQLNAALQTFKAWNEVP
jgi:hypothetical protein